MMAVRLSKKHRMWKEREEKEEGEKKKKGEGQVGLI